MLLAERKEVLQGEKFNLLTAKVLDEVIAAIINRFSRIIALKKTYPLILHYFENSIQTGKVGVPIFA